VTINVGPWSHELRLAYCSRGPGVTSPVIVLRVDIVRICSMIFYSLCRRSGKFGADLVDAQAAGWHAVS
jgi:hypothetical protein